MKKNLLKFLLITLLALSFCSVNTLADIQNNDIQQAISQYDEDIEVYRVRDQLCKTPR